MAASRATQSVPTRPWGLILRSSMVSTGRLRSRPAYEPSGEPGVRREFIRCGYWQTAGGCEPVRDFAGRPRPEVDELPVLPECMTMVRSGLMSSMSE